MIIILSCSLISSLIIFYFKQKSKKEKKQKLSKFIDKNLPQINGCNHKKIENSYFYKDKIYCKFCWSEINNRLLCENDVFNQNIV